MHLEPLSIPPATSLMSALRRRWLTQMVVTLLAVAGGLWGLPHPVAAESIPTPMLAGEGAPIHTLALLALTAETDVILDGSGQLTITDVNGGTSDDTLTLSINGANLRVNDPGNILAGSGTGVVQVNDNTVDVPLANITAGIVIDTVDGVDTVHLNAALDLGSGDLEVTAQTVNVNAPVTVSGSAVISMTARQNMNVNSAAPLSARMATLPCAPTRASPLLSVATTV